MTDPPPSDGTLTPTCEDDPERAVVEEVLRWIMLGNAETDIRDALREKHPTANHKRVLTRCLKALRDEGSPDVDVVRGFAIMAYRDLYRRCLEIGDFDGARKMIKELVAMTVK